MSVPTFHMNTFSLAKDKNLFEFIREEFVIVTYGAGCLVLHYVC